MSRHNFNEVEKKWQSKWESEHTFKVEVDQAKPKSYVLEMLPYPSGKLHMGHVRNYTLGDVLSRYKKQKGFNVMHPMGWDSFGLPAENAAMQHDTHPGKWTYENIDFMRQQIKSLGMSYDWDREIATCHPKYFKHEQQMFIDFLKKGLAYRKESLVNWDPVENTVLANEQVVDGKGWRSGAVVELKKLNQWFLKITDYSEELIAGLKEITDWPEKVRTMQNNWIGKSQGMTIVFPVDNSDQVVEIFTTRPDTFFGASFIGISPNHAIALDLAKDNKDLAKFIEECNQTDTSEEAVAKAEKKGVDTGLRVKHHITGDLLPIYVANFVLMGYGTGAVYGVPAHDQRDFEFATKYKLPIIEVVKPLDYKGDDFKINDEAYTTYESVHFNSQFLNGLTVVEAKEKMMTYMEEHKIGRRETNYRLHDWGVSRQRYWGCPVPIVYCDEHGAVPVNSSDLPITLPDDVEFKSAGNPLENHPTWKHTTCPTCGKPAIRETDTFDTFFESSWYFLRYLDPRNEEQAFAQDKAKYWMNVDHYIGGVEHAVMHLLYARFFNLALRDCGYLDSSMESFEPFKALLTQGMICHETYKDEDGNWVFPDDVIKLNDGTYQHAKTRKKVTIGRVEKMSKSKKNVVDPDFIIRSYGADTARMFVVSDSPPDRDLEWTESGADGCWRFLNRVWRMVEEKSDIIQNIADQDSASFTGETKKIYSLIHKTIFAVEEELPQFQYNKIIARIRELTNSLSSMSLDDDHSQYVYKFGMEAVTRLLNPITPHITEEIWEVLFKKKTQLSQTPWIEYDKNFLVDDTVTIAIQVNGKVRNTLEVPKDISKEDLEKIALDDEKIKNNIAGKTIRKVIVVPARIVNIVAN